MKPPYYAVIFTSTKSDTDEGYAEMAQKMETLARHQPGFLGLESARSKIGITISYWATEQAIVNWKNNMGHQMAQTLGKEKWYTAYEVRVCRVERAYGFIKEG